MRAILTFALAAAACASMATAQSPSGKRYAVLVGVKEYDHARLAPLKYTENDVAAVGKVLAGRGYTVVLLTDSTGGKEPDLRPSRANVHARLKEVLDRCRRADTVLVGLAGHGVQFDGQKDSFFCPVDAHPTKPETLVSLKAVYQDLDECGAGVKLLLVDACRDDPTGGRGSRGIDGDSAPPPPRGVAALYSCSAGQRAFEHAKLEHGVFFYHVLKGLEGKAKDGDEEVVTWDGLRAYVKKQVSRQVPDLIGGGATQLPNEVGNLSGESPVLLSLRAAPGEGVAVVPAPPHVAGTAARTGAKWVYAHDLRIRSGGTTDFAAAPKVGVEFYLDEFNGTLVAISESGALAVAAVPPIGAEKKAKWATTHDLRARKAGEPDFRASTKKYGVELFEDTASGLLLYASEKRGIALASAPPSLRPGRGPKWHHALELTIRGTDKIGLEAFEDECSGGLIYVTEAGHIAAAPAPAAVPAKVKDPKLLYELTLRVRKADETKVPGSNREVGVDVFRDENTGGLLFVSETGSIAAAPTPAEMTAGAGPTRTHALKLKARPGGTAAFATANEYGVEVYRDGRTGHLIYVSETGSIAVLAGGAK